MSAAHPDSELIPYFRGELEARERDQVFRHLEDCRQCRESMDELASTLNQVASRLEELTTPEWTAYRRELRLRVTRRTERPDWWRWQGLRWTLVAAAALAMLIIALSMRPATQPEMPPFEQLAMEQDMAAPDVGLLRNYPVLEQLDLLENYDVIEHLDELPAEDSNGNRS